MTRSLPVPETDLRQGNTMTMTTHNPMKRNGRGFTLSEMLVAVGLVALLTVGIGQVFQNISRLVGTGAAVAEVDQRARLIENLLRGDFETVGALRPEEYVVVIRQAETEPVYTTREERDLDLREGLTRNDADSRAFSRRIDELAIITASTGAEGALSYQFNGPEGGNEVRAGWVRLYYGHGLRPAPDLEYDPRADRIPQRYMVPDGYFGQEPGDRNTRDIGANANGGDVSAWGLNEFAGNWIMARQPLLLYGGAALGINTNDSSVQRVGTRIEVAPYIRDFETEQRFYRNGENVGDDIPNGGQSPLDRPNPRLVRHGRTDVCGQSYEEAKRWLEGQAPGGSDATAFSEGGYDVSTMAFPEVDPGVQDAPLYIRTALPNNPDRTIRENRRRLLSAVAGIIQRPLCDDIAPTIDRGGPVDAGIEPEDAIMDLHATLASHCSNLEISWSDGTTAVADFTLNGKSFNTGDIIWFDQDLTRIELEDFNRNIYRAIPDHIESEFPEDEAGQLIRRLGGDVSRINQQFVGYDPYTTGGQDPGDMDTFNEYLAVWPFRKPAGDGSYGPAWTKPQLVRFRITLHDSLGRLPEGKTFEFIFSLAYNGGA